MVLLKRFAAPAGALALLASLAVHLLLPELSNLVSALLGLGLFLVLLGVFFNLSFLRDRLKGRAAREGGGDAAYIIVVAVVLGLLNFLAVRHHWRKDLSERGDFSLSEQTRKILSGLPREVEARAYFYGGTLAEQKMKDLLEEYGYQARGKFHVRFIDPLKDPSQAKEDGITQEQSLVLRSGSRSTTVLSGDEEAVTNAVLKVTRDSIKTLCFAIGHAEPSHRVTGRRCAGPRGPHGESYREDRPRGGCLRGHALCTEALTLTFRCGQSPSRGRAPFASPDRAGSSCARRG